jgi:hypothetical protein
VLLAKGLGNPTAWLTIHIGNEPKCPQGLALSPLKPMSAGELTLWLECNSNHWRKIFNIIAKLMFQLEVHEFESWQSYRDERLLQADSGCALVFGPPKESVNEPRVQIITGKQFAESLGKLDYFTELQPGFFHEENSRLIVTPYFDYRQLSNVKVDYLASLVQRIRKA